MNKACKLLMNWKQYPRKMVQIVRDPHSNNTGEVEFVIMSGIYIFDKYINAGFLWKIWMVAQRHQVLPISEDGSLCVNIPR